MDICLLESWEEDCFPWLILMESLSVERMLRLLLFIRHLLKLLVTINCLCGPKEIKVWAASQLATDVKKEVKHRTGLIVQGWKYTQLTVILNGLVNSCPYIWYEGKWEYQMMRKALF